MGTYVKGNNVNTKEVPNRTNIKLVGIIIDVLRLYP